jgi:hypothetical protein
MKGGVMLNNKKLYILLVMLTMNHVVEASYIQMLKNIWDSTPSWVKYTAATVLGGCFMWYKNSTKIAQLSRDFEEFKKNSMKNQYQPKTLEIEIASGPLGKRVEDLEKGYTKIDEIIKSISERFNGRFKKYSSLVKKCDMDLTHLWGFVYSQDQEAFVEPPRPYIKNFALNLTEFVQVKVNTVKSGDNSPRSTFENVEDWFAALASQSGDQEDKVFLHSPRYEITIEKKSNDDKERKE